MTAVRIDFGSMIGTYKTGERRYHGGFTLLELVTALAILVVLTALMAPALLQYVEKARQQRYVAEAESVCDAIQMYLIDSEMKGMTLSELELVRVLNENEVCSANHVLYPYLTQKATAGAEIKSVYFKDSRFTGIDYQIDGYTVSAKTAGDIRIVKDKQVDAVKRTE